MGTRQRRFTAAGLPIPRVPLGATNAEQRGAAAGSLQLAVPPSDSAESVKEVRGPELRHQGVPLADQQGRTPSRVNHFDNHWPTSTGRTPSPVLHHPPQ